MSDDFSLGPVQIKLSPVEQFARFLQSQGKRVTQQRRLIVSEAMPATACSEVAG